MLRSEAIEHPSRSCPQSKTSPYSPSSSKLALKVVQAPRVSRTMRIAAIGHDKGRTGTTGLSPRRPAHAACKAPLVTPSGTKACPTRWAIHTTSCVVAHLSPSSAQHRCMQLSLCGPPAAAGRRRAPTGFEIKCNNINEMANWRGVLWRPPGNPDGSTT